LNFDRVTTAVEYHRTCATHSPQKTVSPEQQMIVMNLVKYVNPKRNL